MSYDVLGGHSNTRPPNRKESDLRSLVDWVSATLDLPFTFDEFKELFGLEKLPFEYFDWGRNTFHEHFRFSNIVIQRKNKTTYQILFSGQACREFENYSLLNWYDFFEIVVSNNGKFTRLDLAIDDFKGYYSVDMINQAFRDDRLISRLRSREYKQSYDSSVENQTMNSFYIGSMNSRLSINIYDKFMERKANGFDLTVEKWTRTELRLKREYANEVVNIILLEKNSLGEIIKGILSEHMRIIRKTNVKNKSEVSNVKWWNDFLNGVEGIQLSLQAPDKTIERTKKWLEHSVSCSLAMMSKLDDFNYEGYIEKLIIDGNERLNDKHKKIIEQYNIKRKKINAIYQENGKQHL